MYYKNLFAQTFFPKNAESLEATDGFHYQSLLEFLCLKKVLKTAKFEIPC